MELLKALAVQFALAEESAMFKVCSFLLFISGLLELHSLTTPFCTFQPLEPDFDDFVEHLQPYAWMYIRRKKEESDVCHYCN
jgi:hypothetical protein